MSLIYNGDSLDGLKGWEAEPELCLLTLCLLEPGVNVPDNARCLLTPASGRAFSWVFLLGCYPAHHVVEKQVKVMGVSPQQYRKGQIIYYKEVQLLLFLVVEHREPYHHPVKHLAIHGGHQCAIRSVVSQGPDGSKSLIQIYLYPIRP